jgi:hypothetical protein
MSIGVFVACDLWHPLVPQNVCISVFHNSIPVKGQDEVVFVDLFHYPYCTAEDCQKEVLILSLYVSKFCNKMKKEWYYIVS